jgi:hypothetical protein
MFRILVVDDTPTNLDLTSRMLQHGAGIATKAGHWFKIKVETGGLDGITYDEPDDKILLTNHSRPIGTLVALDPNTGEIVAWVELEDTAPEGAVADRKGHIFVNNEIKNTMQVIDVKTWKTTASWPLSPCAGVDGNCVRQGFGPRFYRLQQYLGCCGSGFRQGCGFD